MSKIGAMPYQVIMTGTNGKFIQSSGCTEPAMAGAAVVTFQGWAQESKRKSGLDLSVVVTKHGKEIPVSLVVTAYNRFLARSN